MKDKTLSRLDRLEEVIHQGVCVPLVAMRDANGIHWNGNDYPDHESFDRAARMILGESQDKPIIIIRLRGELKNEESDR